MIEVCLQVPEPDGLDVEAAVSRAGRAALTCEGAGSAWFCATVADDDTLRTLNREYRGIDRPTDVLSFPMGEGQGIAAMPDGFLGDVILSLPRARAQAAEHGHSLLRELSFLTVHGALHLLGYDHIEPEQAARMLKRQDEILTEMGVLR